MVGVCLLIVLVGVKARCDGNFFAIKALSIRAAKCEMQAAASCA